jgi:CelD/BcsL family acetyltransferase involved in cellulose biosynthesis
MGMSAHAVPLQGNFAAWRAANMAASYCKELDKKSRQLHRKGSVSFECSSNPEAIEATFRKMRDYRRPRFEGRGDGDLLQHQAYFDFYLDIAIRSRAILSRIYTMSMDGRPIAGVMGLAHGGRFLVILGGFDLSTYKNQSIGSLMFEQVARDCIERGDRELDFTIGDEPYKSLFGARASSMYMVSRANSPLGAIVGLAVEQAPWIKAVAKRLMPRGRAVAPLPPAVASVETAAES